MSRFRAGPVALPVVMVLHELLMVRRTLSEAGLEEIVDVLFLPLVVPGKTHPTWPRVARAAGRPCDVRVTAVRYSCVEPT
ncbi:hypothetical protein [Streptomyces sp. NPDC059446]|uniref:hypothetical protein n=1 Tax=Streptomyces sp. NPDC059446 TaxID=3346833 RepID=UPI0036B5D972